MFCLAMDMVFLAIRMASGRRDSSSVMMTTSAASMAASLPRPPIATPTSAAARTGASLMPSPAYTTLPSFFSSSRWDTFSSGSS